MTVFTISQNFIAIRQKEHCLRRKYVDFQKMLSDPCLNIAEESVERHFGIESKHFDSNHFNELNKFVEDNYQYFYPPEDPDYYQFDVGNEHELVADVDAQTLIKLVKFLKRGKTPGPNTIHNEVLRLGTTTSLFHHLARLFTSSIQLGYIPTAWKLATLCMLLKPDKIRHPYY